MARQRKKKLDKLNPKKVVALPAAPPLTKEEFWRRLATLDEWRAKELERIKQEYPAYFKELERSRKESSPADFAEQS